MLSRQRPRQVISHGLWSQSSLTLGINCLIEQRIINKHTYTRTCLHVNTNAIKATISITVNIGMVVYVFTYVYNTCMVHSFTKQARASTFYNYIN